MQKAKRKKIATIIEMYAEKNWKAKEIGESLFEYESTFDIENFVV